MASQASLQVYEPDENAPSTVKGPSVTLQLYKPSGLFCGECCVSTSKTISSFIQLLEMGQISPELNLACTKTRAPWRNTEAGIERLHVDYVYKLVWNDKVLLDWWTFQDYVVCDGMSENEANRIYVIKQENVTTVMTPDTEARER